MTRLVAVAEIETVDGEYCFWLRDGVDRFVLLGFPTEQEAMIARRAMLQIVDHASFVLPCSREPAEPGAKTAIPEDRPDNGLKATSPFSDA
ncbi:MAG TPA: hypothetical protein VGI20_09785 [Rhizomicrobium sp.]